MLLPANNSDLLLREEGTFGKKWKNEKQNREERGKLIKSGDKSENLSSVISESSGKSADLEKQPHKGARKTLRRKRNV